MNVSDEKLSPPPIHDIEAIRVWFNEIHAEICSYSKIPNAVLERLYTLEDDIPPLLDGLSFGRRRFQINAESIEQRDVLIRSVDSLYNLYLDLQKLAKKKFAVQYSKRTFIFNRKSFPIKGENNYAKLCDVCYPFPPISGKIPFEKVVVKMKKMYIFQN